MMRNPRLPEDESKSTAGTATGYSGKQPRLGRQVYRQAIIDAFLKLNPRWMVRNPVMFVTEVGSILTTALWVQALLGHGEARAGFIGGVSLWLWLCVLFANFSTALAESGAKRRRLPCAEHDRKLRPKSLVIPNTGLNMTWFLPARCDRRTCSLRKLVILLRLMAR